MEEDKNKININNDKDFHDSEKKYSINKEIEENRNKIFKEEERESHKNNYDFGKENRKKSMKISKKESKDALYLKYKQDKRKKIVIEAIVLIFLIYVIANIIFLYKIDKNIEKTMLPNQTIGELNNKNVSFTETIDEVTFDIYDIDCKGNELTINYGIKNKNNKFQPLIENSSLIPLNANEGGNSIKFKGLSHYNNMVNKFLLKDEATEGFITFNANNVIQINEGYYQFKLPFYTEKGLNEINIDFKI